MKIHHIAISVPDLEQALSFYKKHFGFEETFRFKRDDLKVSGVFCDLNGTTLEFLQSHEEFDANHVEAQSPNFKRLGLNHFCILIDDIEKKSSELRADGIHVPQPIEGAKTRIVFFIDPFGTTVELYQNR